MSHIFISYSHKDKEYVHKLHDALVDEGFDVWIDDRIDYGDKWLKAIEKNLDECDAFIIVMSKNSSESEMVQNEITRARDLEKQIFPLLLDGRNWLVVQSRQFVDVRDGSLPTEKFYKRLETVTQRRNKKAEREAAEKLAREIATRAKAAQEGTEIARLEAEEQARKKSTEEKAEREEAKKTAKERAAREKVAREKKERETAEIIAKEKIRREIPENPTPKVVKPKSVNEKQLRTGTDLSLKNLGQASE